MELRNHVQEQIETTFHGLYNPIGPIKPEVESLQCQRLVYVTFFCSQSSHCGPVKLDEMLVSSIPLCLGQPDRPFKVNQYSR